MKEISIWFMRENHTFLKLDNDLKNAINQLKKEYDDGEKCGTVHTKIKGMESDATKGGYNIFWDDFKEEIEKWWARFEIAKEKFLAEKIFNLEEHLIQKFHEYRDLCRKNSDTLELAWNNGGKLLAICEVMEAAGFKVPE